MNDTVLLLVGLLVACGPKPGPEETGVETSETEHSETEPSETASETETGGAPDYAACSEAEARLGYAACVHVVADEPTFELVTVPGTVFDQLRVGKYLVPAVADARLPPVFLITSVFDLHYDFLVTAFPDDFAGLTTDGYGDLVLYPDTREFFAGTLSLYLDGSEVFYGFTVWDDPSDDTSTVTLDDVTEAWETLQGQFPLGPLVFMPNSGAQIEAASGWTDAPFPIGGLESDVEYEAYNVGEAYGTLRLYTLSDLEDATSDAEYGYQDILILEEAPVDLERVVSGIVTGTRQGALSHLAVRSASRGTPNCYVQDPLGALDAWDGMLVRFECGETGWTVEAADPDDAIAWWDSIRPDPVDICPPDLTQTAYPGLLEVPTATALDRDVATCQFGAKGTNLATLYQRIDPNLTVDGFLIPFVEYVQFVETATWTVDLGGGPAEHTFAETIAAWHADELFLTDPTVRRDRLDDLMDAMEDAPVDAATLRRISDRVVEVYGADTVMARFRSSSNAEDSLGFSGAGLYTSESGCVADEYDGDEDGPSRCDPDKPEEEGIRRAITQVWASVWGMAAWEERDWYGMDQSKVVMGILVNPRAKNEQANIVAFSANPGSPGDPRQLVNAQEGELAVVEAESGVVPETILVTVSGGVVTEILRVSGSSEVPDGEVLTDLEVTELSIALEEIAAVYPQDEAVPKGHEVVWDTEWKILEDGRLSIKQIRPFLR